MRPRNLLVGALLLGPPCCKPPVDVTPAPAEAPAELTAISGASVVIATGDIASCESQGDEQTAALVDSLLRADSVAGVEDVVATLGDHVYPNGAAGDFVRCFGPSWGDSTKMIKRKMRPSPGNHEHRTDMAAPYYAYFGKNAGSPTKGYYSYDHGEWHMIALNSEIVVNAEFIAEDRKAQEDWLRDDLEKNSKPCTLAYWHHPRYSSGWHDSDTRLAPLWRILYERGVDVVLVGHDHEYERFHPQNADGVADTVTGIPQFVVGTGGGELRGFRRTIVRNSAARVQGHFGVLKLTLGKGEFRWAFLDTSGRIWDPGGGKCH